MAGAAERGPCGFECRLPERRSKGDAEPEAGRVGLERLGAEAKSPLMVSPLPLGP